MPTAAILGAAGYSGRETLDRLLSHPELSLLAIGSDSHAGRPAFALDPRLARARLPQVVSNDDALAAGADVVFCCLGHAEAAALVPPPDAIVVDLSGAHRLRDPAAYEQWYGFAHPHPGSLGHWCYGVPELARPASRLIANPGCYATAALLALAPIIHLIDPDEIVVDGKSGISGAGQAPTERTHAVAVLDTVTPYRIGTHQHVPELEQWLGAHICFVPHVVPLRRGLLATCYVRPRAGGLREAFDAAYGTSAVVTLLPPGTAPELLRVQGADGAEVALFEERDNRRAVVIAAIDNLGKGAAGQAVQNVNLALGLPETSGLRLGGVLV